MGQRGKQSAAALSTVPRGDISALHRPEPFAGLTVDQANVWRDVVGGMPAEWFPQETLGMLAQYCRHVVSSNHVGELIENMLAQPEIDIDGYDKLLKMQEREGRAMSSLATRMRISQQSQYNKDKKKKTTLPNAPHNS